MDTGRRILGLLATGKPQSGEALGAALGCTRAAVWKQIESLRALGLPIAAEAGRGYSLSPPVELLDGNLICKGLTSEQKNELVEFDVAWLPGSTNAEVLGRQPENRHGVAVVAEGQTSGRGRRGRHWVSPFAQNVYLSLGWRFDSGIAALAEWPLAVAVVVCRSLAELGLEGHGVKWPNDIVIAGRKLGGCLVEVQGDASGPCSAVMGVGLNVHMDQATAGIDQPFTSLSEFSDVSRNAVASALLGGLLSAARVFAQSGFDSFREDWRKYDRLCGQPVRVLLGSEAINGTACGLSERGGLLVKTADGTREFHAGEVSIRQGRGGDDE